MLSSTASQMEHKKENIIETIKKTISRVYIMLLTYRNLRKSAVATMVPDVVALRAGDRITSHVLTLVLNTEKQL